MLNLRKEFQVLNDVIDVRQKQLNSSSCSLSPGQTDSQVNASLQNQNLRSDLRRVAKRIRKSQKAVTSTHIIG